MRYISTRGSTAPQSFTDAVITGLAPDGGLLVPEQIPDIRAHLHEWTSLGFVELAKALLPHFIDDIPAATLRLLIDRAYARFDHPEVVCFRPLSSTGSDVQVMELFHGPTLAFKDIALQLLGQLFEYVLDQRQQHLNILGATSGDTGSAAISGVRGLAAVDVFIMYPRGRVSPLQELQMTTVLDANVHCLAVEGSFDDCQNLMKTVFNDANFKSQYSLGAVNSVNWARVLAQIVYYGYASLRFGERAPVSFCVPTGNFGNLFAGYMARRMGFPIDRLIVATNANDILSVFFESGRYQRGTVHHTMSPAMDIQVASNFERYLFYHFDQDAVQLCEFMDTFARTGCASLPGGDSENSPVSDVLLATTVSEAETLDTIARIYRQDGYVADPHTAVGLAAAERFDTRGVKICVATAHPAKFPESVNRAVGANVAVHPALEALKGLKTRSTVIPATVAAVQDYLRKHAG